MHRIANGRVEELCANGCDALRTNRRRICDACCEEEKLATRKRKTEAKDIPCTIAGCDKPQMAQRRVCKDCKNRIEREQRKHRVKKPRAPEQPTQVAQEFREALKEFWENGS